MYNYYWLLRVIAYVTIAFSAQHMLKRKMGIQKAKWKRIVYLISYTQIVLFCSLMIVLSIVHRYLQ